MYPYHRCLLGVFVLALGLSVNSLFVPTLVAQDDSIPPMIRQAAEEGFSDAQHFVGINYYYGRSDWDIPKDFSEAAHWFRRAAEQGHPTAQILLAELYERGEGVP